MNLRIDVLHFTEGISSLRGAMSISRGKVEGGPAAMKDIRPGPRGYLVTRGDGRVFLVPDHRVVCAEVVDLDAEKPTETAAPAQPPAAAPAPEQPAAKLTMAIGDGVAMDPKTGVFSRPNPETSPVHTSGPVEGAADFKLKRNRPGPTPAKG